MALRSTVTRLRLLVVVLVVLVQDSEYYKINK